MSKSSTSQYLCQRNAEIFFGLGRPFQLNLESETSTLWLIPENPIAGGRRVIQQLHRRAVNDRMCQIMNNELDHKREEEGWRRRSRNVCTLPAFTKLTANSWEENQATGFSSKLVPIPLQKNSKVLFWKLFRMLRSKVISTLKSHRRG